MAKVRSFTHPIPPTHRTDIRGTIVWLLASCSPFDANRCAQATIILEDIANITIHHYHYLDSYNW